MHGRFYLIILIINLNILSYNAFGLELNNPNYYKSLSDSIKDKMLVEYDTVVLPPDTIRITDTLTIAYNTATNNDTKEKTPKLNNKITKSLNQQHSYTFSICVSPFVTGQYIFPGKLKDSLTYPRNQPLNYYYEISSGLKFKNWFYYAEFHFISFSEIIGKGQFATSPDTIETNDEIIYGTKTVQLKSQIKNYFYYAGILIGAGYELEKRNWIFTPQAGISISRQLPGKSYEFGNGINIKEIPDGNQPDYWFSISLSPAVGYKLTKNLLFLVLPAYVYNFYGKNVYPLTYRQNLRFGLGLRYEL